MDRETQVIRPVQRLRLTFSKGGAARYISHLDLARALERAINRAGLPVAYTQGFNRRPRLSLAAALPLGYTSEAEAADVWLVEQVAPEIFRERLAACMAPGIVLLACVEIPLSAPSMQQQLTESTYEVRFLDQVNPEALVRAVDELLAAESVERLRQRPKGNKPQSYDLRPLVHAIEVVEGTGGAPGLRLRLAQTPTQTGRPDDVLSALGYDPLDVHVHRVELRFADDVGAAAEKHRVETDDG